MTAVKVSWWTQAGRPIAVVGDFVGFLSDGTFTVLLADGPLTIYPNERDGRVVEALALEAFDRVLGAL